MTYQEKKIWISLIAGVGIFVLYLRRALEAYNVNGYEIFKDVPFWAKTMLLYIGIGIVLMIIVQIIAHIIMAADLEIQRRRKLNQGQGVSEVESYFEDEDEMDHLISLKSGRVGYTIIGIGFVWGLITIVAGMPAGIMLNIYFLSFMLGSMMDEAIKLYYYKRGVNLG